MDENIHNVTKNYKFQADQWNPTQKVYEIIINALLQVLTKHPFDFAFQEFHFDQLLHQNQVNNSLIS